MMDAKRNATDSHHANRSQWRQPTGRPARSVLDKDDWVQLYTRRILQAWSHRQTPLGLAHAYTNWIRKDLARHYAKPLMRAFIEETYQAKMD